MLPLLHTTIKELLHTRGNIPRGEADVRVDRPTRQWLDALTSPTLNMFLFDIAESAEFRNASAQTTRSNGWAKTKLAPRRFDLRYLVSAISTEADDEHELLWRALAALLKFPVLPAELLPDELLALDIPINTKVGAYTDAPRPLDIWGALDLPPRAALLYTVTAPLDLEQTLEAPLVFSRALRVTRTTEADEAAGRGIDPRRITQREAARDYAPLEGVALDPRGDAADTDPQRDGTRFALAGVVRDGDGKPVAGVAVRVKGRGIESTTNSAGRFRLAELPRGRLTLVVVYGNAPPREVQAAAPWPFDATTPGIFEIVLEAESQG